MIGVGLRVQVLKLSSLGQLTFGTYVSLRMSA